MKLQPLNPTFSVWCLMNVRLSQIVTDTVSDHLKRSAVSEILDW